MSDSVEGFVFVGVFGASSGLCFVVELEYFNGDCNAAARTPPPPVSNLDNEVRLLS